MKASGRKKITFSVVIPFIIFILLFSCMIWQKYRSSHDIPATPVHQSAVGRRPVTLFFVADGTRLVREARELDPCDDVMVCLKNTLDELLNGPIGEFGEAVPDGTSVNSVRIEGNLATVEFNRTFSDGLAPGSSAEMMAVYSVVNTVAVNFPQIQLVKLNVDGETDVKLSHLDLSDPLSPDYSLEELPATTTQGNP
ncbi:MAG: GerMN domain-containing protein [Desulfuromonadaceae bacterium]|nr:GerMN domain-containing protein [Desulfuromonadaceae bacterium]